MDGESQAAASAAVPTIFLSYSRDDRAKAEAIVSALEGRGLTVWWDGLIEGGHEFAQQIEQALNAADAVVVLWSKSSIQSYWVRDEAASGRDRGRMVPVTIDGVEPPLGFRQIQHVDFTGWRGGATSRQAAALDQAIRAVAQMPGATARRPAAAKAPLLSRRTALVGGAAGAALIGGGLWASKLLHPAMAQGTNIAVLPFRNLSGNPAESYFSDGIAEELRATLSQNSGLAVAAETSSGVAAKASSDPRAIGAALGVGFLVEGSVRREAGMVRIGAQIVDTQTGFDKWSQTFDQKLDSILAVQSEVADFVTDALLSGIAAAKAPRDRLGGTKNDAAFDAYLRGMALYNLAEGEESDFKALAMFQRAVTLDPGYAVANAALSRAYTVISNTYSIGDKVASFRSKAVDAAQSAIRIAPRLADGYSALGFVLLNGELNPSAAASAYQRSFELGYGDSDILASYASFAGRTGRFADGRVAIARAERLDPLNATIFRTSGMLEFDARQYEAASRALNTALGMNPQANIIHQFLGDIALLNGDATAARAQYQQEPDPIGRLRGLAIADMKLGNAQAAQASLSELIAKYGAATPYQQAQVYAQWGRSAQALASLEQAISTRDAGVVRAKTDPLLDPIRKTVRFAQVERELGYS